MNDDPYDAQAPNPRRGADHTPDSSAARRPGPQGHAPGRASRGSSRARSGGSAQPVGSSQTPSARRPPAPARPDSASRRRPAQQAGAPRAYPPGGDQAPDGGPTPTRVMPAGQRPGAEHRGSQRPPSVPARGPAVQGTRQRPLQGRPTRRRHRRRRVVTVVVIVLVLILAWPVGLLIWANGKIQHTDALSGAEGQPGTTYLLAGSDSRADGTLEGDTTEGQRTDTIMLLTVPADGHSSLISIPRDTYVDIPGHDPNKINAAYAFGGAPLLVETVEGFTGVTVDHYVEIGMGGVAGLVDAVGGVELCMDLDVDDPDSGLEWTAGCHEADGETALAFARMRHGDPEGDIGRTKRQQQVIQAVTKKVANVGTLINPGSQVNLLDAGLAALTVDEDTGIIDLGRLALGFRSATGEDGVRGTPPIASYDYRPGGVGSAVLIEPDVAKDFFASVLDGTVTIDD